MDFVRLERRCVNQRGSGTVQLRCTFQLRRTGSEQLRGAFELRRANHAYFDVRCAYVDIDVHLRRAHHEQRGAIVNLDLRRAHHDQRGSVFYMGGVEFERRSGL